MANEFPTVRQLKSPNRLRFIGSSWESQWKLCIASQICSPSIHFYVYAVLRGLGAQMHEQALLGGIKCLQREYPSPSIANRQCSPQSNSTSFCQPLLDPTVYCDKTAIPGPPQTPSHLSVSFSQNSYLWNCSPFLKVKCSLFWRPTSWLLVSLKNLPHLAERNSSLSFPLP